MARVVIEGGKRIGKGRLQFEQAFRQAIANGDDVITGPRNGVFFSVMLNEDGSLNYWPHPGRPEGV